VQFTERHSPESLSTGRASGASEINVTLAECNPLLGGYPPAQYLYQHELTHRSSSAAHLGRKPWALTRLVAWWASANNGNRSGRSRVLLGSLLSLASCSCICTTTSRHIMKGAFHSLVALDCHQPTQPRLLPTCLHSRFLFMFRQALWQQCCVAYLEV
jgi:hypothetical protein